MLWRVKKWLHNLHLHTFIGIDQAKKSEDSTKPLKLFFFFFFLIYSTHKIRHWSKCTFRPTTFSASKTWQLVYGLLNSTFKNRVRSGSWKQSHIDTITVFFFLLNTDTITVINCHGIRNINFALLLIAAQGKRDINYFERIMTLSIFLK